MSFGDNNYINRKCLQFIEKTENFKFAKGDCQPYSYTQDEEKKSCSESVENRCIPKKGNGCVGKCACDTKWLESNKCVCLKDKWEFTFKVKKAIDEWQKKHKRTLNSDTSTHSDDMIRMQMGYE